MPERYRDWLQQASRDLDHARMDVREGFYEWAAFAAQQAAEKACKALHLFLGSSAWGHDVTDLLAHLPPEHQAPTDLIDRAKRLDKHYLPARYPNGFAAGTPMEHYTRPEPSRPSPTPRPSLGSVVVRHLDRERVLADLRDLAAGIGAKNPEVREIRLFGSLARGERNPYADADLLIVLDRCDLPYRDRQAIYKPVGAQVPTDLIVCAQAELDREVAAANPFLLQILRDGLVLYTRAAPIPAA